jgi:diguanylate cyclase (GGDEF)-like protein/putative nucleotidyltransferase with HDIG domain
MKLFPLSQYRTSTKVLWFVSLVATVPVLWLLFYFFGKEFGFVLAPLVATAVLSYRMHLKRLAQKTLEISEASRVHLATVEALATAIDARDQVGVGHVRRTQIYAVGIGKILGLSESDINALRTGALLHDIGKLAVPDHILNKPGSLSPAELEKTKIHSLVGASILEKVGFNYPVIPTVKYHHESWDGSGYPDGLQKDGIPLTARILAVADAFDTLRGARPYRAALTRDKARKIIQAEAGRRFDPAIVNILVRNLGALETEINAESLAYLDSETSAKAFENHNYVEQIKLANREVFSLYELAREFSSSEDLQETLGLFANKIGEFVPFDTCALYLLDDTKRFADAAYVEGDDADILTSQRIKVGSEATGHALKMCETVQNVDPDPDFAYSQIELTGQYSTMASVPLIADEVLIGAVTIYARELAAYGEEHIRLLETISRIAADAIGKSLRHDEAKNHAMTDPLTGLPNARSLVIQFEKEVARANRGDSSFQLLMLDLDGFKAVNDSFGHIVGDEILKEVSKVIYEQLRDYDFLARYGGDEFVALIPETDATDVIDLCDRIEKAVGKFSLPVEGKGSASVGVSLGASGYSKNGESLDQLITAADKAMYNRKTSRKRFALTHNAGQLQRSTKSQNGMVIIDLSDELHDDSLIVELDETHVISSSVIN